YATKAASKWARLREPAAISSPSAAVARIAHAIGSPFSLLVARDVTVRVGPPLVERPHRSAPRLAGPIESAGRSPGAKVSVRCRLSAPRRRSTMPRRGRSVRVGLWRGGQIHGVRAGGGAVRNEALPPQRLSEQGTDQRHFAATRQAR